jgi:hypothetical protein
MLDTDAHPLTAMDASGNFVVVWRHFDAATGIRLIGRRFNGNGKPIGAEFQINENTPQPATLYDVAMDSAGSFIVVWEGDDADGQGIRGRLYDSNGVPNQLGEFRVNDGQTGFQSGPSVTFSDSGFAAAWSDSDTNGVDVRFFGTGGMLPGPEQEFPDPASGAAQVHIAGNSNGEAVVTWSGYETSDFTQLTDISAVHFDSTGTPTPPGRFRVNTFIVSRQSKPKAAMNENGDFVIAWEEANAGHAGARTYDNMAKPLVANEIQATDTPMFRPTNLGLAMDAASFTLTYELFVSGPGARIEAVHYEFDGTKIGNVFTVHDSPPATRNPSIDGNGTSRYVFAYDVTTPPSIVGRLYVNESVTTSSTTSTTLASTLCGDADGNGSITASDALLTLSAAIGAGVCALCQCDLDNSGAITAADALRVLAEAVGLDGMPACMPCT